jgi:VanZ family protein
MLCFRALRPGGTPPAPMWVLLAGVVLATVYGAVGEFHQQFVPTRECDVWDMAANGAGAVLAAVLWDPLTRRYEALR